jgi:16S rRNA (guanine966-N2)-methyltransferase
MRVIAGSLKGRRLAAPPPGDSKIRPTADRAREALFSILEAWPRGPFLDLFSGTGAVALEAHSRGFAPVCCVERDRDALALLRRNVQGTTVEVREGDILRLSSDAFKGLAVVFGDPPYPTSAAMLDALAARIRGWIAPGGLLVWESDSRTALPVPAGFEPIDRRRYGAAAFDFLRPLP